MIQDYFSFLSARMSMEAELLLKVYRKHPGKLGEAREIILQSFFAAYLPKALGVGSGFTITGNESISTEQDIVIFDHLNCPVLFPSNRSAIFPHSAIRCLVEVKSTLDKQDIDESAAKAAAFKKGWRAAPVAPLGENAPHLEPLVCLFGFSGPTLPTVKANLIAAQRDSEEHDRIDLVCLLDSGVVWSGTYFNTATFGQPGSLHAQATDAVTRASINEHYPDKTKAYKLGEHALLAFYYYMTSYIMRMPPRFPDLVKYAPADFVWGNEV